MSEQAIVLNELTKHYGKHRGINNLSFSVNQGEFFGFIGPNGAGKSTTIRTLMGLIRPTGGSASIFDLDCHSKASVIARDVGYLPSENSYYENMKVRELLQYTADLYGMDCKTKMKELADRLNLDLSRKIADLSLGNKKKVGIVSAIMTSPKLIIMDEPTSGLDPLIQQAFYDILKEENSRGATVFFSSHVLSEVQKLCDRVAILKEGQLIGIQSIKELRESGYKKVSLSAKEAIPRDFFDLSGIANYAETADKTSVSFMYNGNITAIIDKLHLLHLDDVLLEEPSMRKEVSGMVILKYELKRHRKYILGWAIALALCVFVMTPTYYSFMDVSTGDLYETLGTSDFYKGVGVSMEYLTSPLGIYAFLTSFFMIASGIFGMHFGIAIHTKECSERTSEYLFTKPHTRKTIYWAKAFTVFFGVVVVSMVYLLASFLALALFRSGIDWGEFFLIALSLMLVTLFLAAMGLLVGILFSRNRSPLLTAGLIVFVEYCVTSFSNIVSNRAISFLSPYSFFSAAEISKSGFYELDYLGWCVLLFALFLVLSYRVFLKKDIQFRS